MKHAGLLLATLMFLGALLSPAAAQTGAGLTALLPAPDAIPVANADVTSGSQDLFTVASTFPDTALAMRDLQSWGFQENVYRDYVASWWDDPYLPTRVEVSLHKFRTAAGAEAAKAAYAPSRANALGLSA
ncbi:MAG: hypothetical protein ACR2J8_07690, partial [Thermomicrobiales bacterium]